MGSVEFAQSLYEELRGEFETAIVTYKGSGKKFFQTLAQQLKIPTEVEDENGKGKVLTMDALKDEIAENIGDQTLLIFPESKRLTTAVRYWLEDAIANGTKVVCFAVTNPGKEIFLDMIEIELELPDDARIREVMQQEAERQSLQISRSRLAELQPLAGRNPMLARKVIRNEKLGLKQEKVEHTQYIVIMPILIAMLFLLAVARFIGMGTGNKALYITGGVAFVAAMALKQLGQVRGARKRFGQ